MGKWTPNYTDDVLHAKISALVTGAIRRSAAENPGALPPTYNEFVHELDTGDSFTTTMIDIMVKEVMERRKRPAGDRRLISDKTAKSLRLLSGTLNVYHGRSTRQNRYQTARSMARDGFFVDTDDDDFDLIPDDPNPAEGSHMSSSELFEAMSTRANPPMASTSMADDNANVPPPPLVLPARSGRTSPWTVLPATSTNPNTTRTTSQQALRRAVRSRTTDLSDFTRRTRPSMRAALTARPSTEVVTEPREDTWDFRTQSSTQRRFFALNRLRRDGMRRQTPGISEGSGDDETMAFMSVEGPIAGSSTMPTDAPPGLQAWPETQQIFVSPRAVMLRDIEAAPPLRRGGVRPPESLFAQVQPYMRREASPAPTLPLPVTEANATEPASYPTPGSVDNEQST